MFYLKPSFRILWRNRFTTFINVGGLAVGICSCLLIYMFVQNELSFDQHHSKKDRLFRLVSDMSLGGEDDQMGLSSYMLSPTLKADYPEVEEAVRVMPVRKQTMWVDDKPFQFEDNLMSDAGFFSMFDYDFIEGNPKTALAEPGSVVITDEVADKMFGKTSGLLGQSIQYARRSYKITGVVKDVKNNSHLYFNTMLSISSIPPQLKNALENDWFYLNQTNYVLLRKGTDVAGFKTKLDQLRDKYIVPWLKSVGTEGKIRFTPQPITEIHLSKSYPAGYAKSGNASYIYIFSIVAVFILIIACINYVNLATATASKRAKEIGIRKTAGAHSSVLFRQFISESVLTAMLAIVLSLLLLHSLLPFFNHLTEKSLSVPYSFSFAGILVLLLFFIGTVAGAYPAFFLSRMEPAAVLKSQKMPGGFSALLRKSLVTVQFFISVAFILGTIVVYSQMHFMKNADLGFNKDQLLVITVPVADTSFARKYEVVKEELSANPNVVKVAGTSSIPGQFSGTLLHTIDVPGQQRQEKAIDIMTVSHEFIKIMDMKVVRGRDFSRSFRTDDSAAFIVNETAVKTYGLKDPFAALVENGMGYKGKIIGVVKDFNYASLHKRIQPLVLMINPQLQGYLLVKIRQGKEAETVRFVETTWKKYSHRYPTEYFFLDDNFDKLYRNEQKMMSVFAYFSILSILISSLGLYALISFSLEQRTKEIGIRKVMGASLMHIVQVMSRDFVFLIGVASILAFPLAWYGMHEWLQDFANRITIEWWMFALAFVLVALVAGVTLVSRILSAATVNPIKSLRTE